MLTDSVSSWVTREWACPDRSDRTMRSISIPMRSSSPNEALSRSVTHTALCCKVLLTHTQTHGVRTVHVCNVQYAHTRTSACFVIYFFSQFKASPSPQKSSTCTTTSSPPKSAPHPPPSSSSSSSSVATGSTGVAGANGVAGVSGQTEGKTCKYGLRQNRRRPSTKDVCVCL